ncbi:hypothetical protein NIES4072_09340 [Nostoc commune NIES-4072]|uniref:Uncharacterized protein n=1 Tax=Nostoc commune NIES-4072 TaxID=2005467 RepID=A0A2R5FGL4_NOSCO|nr:hypothetical protein NIES4070_17490 [Nostoc commune HK-02]GBG17285.1 hypothetical protein NIES4072_09340 [Nostoc commune NIES-4072]
MVKVGMSIPSIVSVLLRVIGQFARRQGSAKPKTFPVISAFYSVVKVELVETLVGLPLNLKGTNVTTWSNLL